MSDNKDINLDFMNDLDTIYKSSKYFKKGNIHKLVFGDKNIFLPRFKDEALKELTDIGKDKFLQPLDLDYNWELIGSLISKVNKYFYLYKDKGRLHQQLKMILPEEGNDVFNTENDPYKTAVHLTYETFVFIKLFCAKFNKNMEEIDKGSLGLIPKREEYPTTTVLRERLNMLKLLLKCHDKDDKPISNKDLFQFLDDNNYNRGDFLQFGPNLLFSFIFFEQFRQNDKTHVGIYLILNENTQKYECPNMEYLFNMFERQISETDTSESLLSKLLQIIVHNNDYYLGQYFNVIEQITQQTRQLITIKQRLEYILIPNDKGSYVPFDGLISVTKKNKLTGPINRCFVFDFDKKNAAFTAVFPLVYEVISGEYLKDYLKERGTSGSTNTKKLPILKIFKFNSSLINDNLISEKTKELLKIILKYNKSNMSKKQ